jgi:DnaD/phage-associated family protein
VKRYQIANENVEKSPAFLSAAKEELRVLYILKASSEPLSLADVARLSALSEDETREALSFWRGAGAVSEADGDTEKPQKTPRKKKPVLSADRLSPYSQSDSARLIEEGNLASFIELCQETYGKVLGSADIETLIGLHDQLHFDCEYICLLIAFCVEHGRKPMRYIEKVAFSLYDRGILTVEDLNDYIEKKHRNDTREGNLRRLFGIGARALTAKEEECFLRWCEEYGYDDSIIGLAYDMTVNATQKASVAYADKILRRFHDAGCKNALEAEEFLRRDREKKASKPAPKKKPLDAEKDGMRSFDVDDFFEHALTRSYGEKK